MSLRIQLPAEFVSIARAILDRGLTEAEWSEVESDDEFQTTRFSGGFDATEQAFCFSYLDEARNELWFQLTLGEIEGVASGSIAVVEAQRAG